MNKQIIAVDPGKDKVGVAVVDSTTGVKEQLIIPADRLSQHLKAIFKHYRIDEIVLGNGTEAEKIEKKISNIKKDIKIHIIDESSTTEEAEARYIKEKPKSRLEKLLHKFVSWRPKTPVDDYAAVIIAEKYLAKLDKQKKNDYNNK
ncbi:MULTISPECIES: Holliday junction resolvase RuvX [unclassified Halanaerobium]|uniref:Holliday junction resolvase RuvX n=1 Tax=unclassified Halanaerobium TaxID=2641197 RepID=UPI000DF1993B|nr:MULTISPECIES: Holliday junction resolvase RuvX [unclassified Halanaerobium]RCW48232.1 RNase H-fold protein (predicted Holliday junction resolvase) [Halanaerobium sp. MA284_MarDTE_T2]RCW85659.1 RNase H-fold protein (predicted Holliday junction resolvase) [Halanaerobium sp. DL-01]